MIKLFVKQSAPPPPPRCGFLPLMSTYSPRNTVLRHPVSVLFPEGEVLLSHSVRVLGKLVLRKLNVMMSLRGDNGDGK
jgi:hypothetical protein